MIPITNAGGTSKKLKAGTGGEDVIKSNLLLSMKLPILDTSFGSLYQELCTIPTT